MDTYFVILEFHLQAGFEDAALIVEEADTVGHFRGSPGDRHLRQSPVSLSP